MKERYPKKKRGQRNEFQNEIEKLQGPNEGKTYSNIYKDKRAHT